MPILEATVENQHLRNRITELEKSKAISDRLCSEASQHMQEALQERSTLKQRVQDLSRALREQQAMVAALQEQL